MNQEIWAIEPERGRLYLEKIENATAQEQELANGGFGAGQVVSDILTIDGEEAEIAIDGVLTPEGPSPLARFFGLRGTGFNQIQAAIEEIEADKNVKTVRLRMDSPGGTVTGTDETFQAVARLAETRKVVAENHGMITSAAFWLAVGADEIVAMSPTVETGSIGVVVMGLDFTVALKKAGIKFVVIRSRNAPDKGAGISTPKEIGIWQARIDAIERVFISRVAEGRNVSEATVRNNFGKGAVLVAQDPGRGKPDAVSVGMIDSVISPVGQVAANIKSNAKLNQHGGGKAMNLNELFTEHPGAKIEHDALVVAEYQKGVDATEASVKARVDKAVAILGSKDYPEAITALAKKVMIGETDPAALEAAVASYDAVQEQAKADAAALETEEAGDTAADGPEAKSEDGVIRNPADMKAENDRMNPGKEDK